MKAEVNFAFWFSPTRGTLGCRAPSLRVLCARAGFHKSRPESGFPNALNTAVFKTRPEPHCLISQNEIRFITIRL
jgi:hypothetical protein